MEHALFEEPRKGDSNDLLTEFYGRISKEILCSVQNVLTREGAKLEDFDYEEADN